MKANTRAILSLGGAFAIGMCIYSTTFTSTALTLGTFEIAAAAMDLLIKLGVLVGVGYLIWYLTKPKGSRRFGRRRY